MQRDTQLTIREVLEAESPGAPRPIQERLAAIKTLDRDMSLKVPRDLRFLHIPEGALLSDGSLADHITCILSSFDDETNASVENADSTTRYQRKREMISSFFRAHFHSMIRTFSKPASAKAKSLLRLLRLASSDRDHHEGTISVMEQMSNTSDSEEAEHEVEYLAVSYCWDGNATSRVPSYLSKRTTILISDGHVTRKQKCPHDVLCRAIAYACRHNISRIWLDQECIDQENPTDVQRHLASMYRIYRNATEVIGVLDDTSTDDLHPSLLGVINSMTGFVEAMALEPTNIGALMGVDDVTALDLIESLVHSIKKDRWLSRTWVLMEREASAGNMVLLLPSYGHQNSEQAKSQPNELIISVGSLIRLPTAWLLSLEEQSGASLEIWHRLEDLQKSIFSLACAPFDIDFRAILDYFSHGATEAVILSAVARMSDPGFITARAFHHIESCDNAIVSDRIAIFANITSQTIHVDTTRETSYSLCILAAVILNEELPSVFIRLPSNHAPEGVKMHDRAGLEEWISDMGELAETFTAVPGLASIRKRLLPGDVRTNIGEICIVPTSASIRDILNGCAMSVQHISSSVTDEHGRMIVDYGIASGQLPQGSEFVAFASLLVWTPNFLDQHVKIA